MLASLVIEVVLGHGPGREAVTHEARGRNRDEASARNAQAQSDKGRGTGYVDDRLMGISAAVAAAATNVAAAAVNATMKGRRDFWECPLGVARGFAQDCGRGRALVKEDLESLCVSSPVACQIPAQSGMGQGVGLVGVRCARDTVVKLSTRDGAAAFAKVAAAVAAAVTNIVVAVAVATAAVVSAAVVRPLWSLDLGLASHKTATYEQRTQGGVGHGTAIEGRPRKHDVCTDVIGDAGGKTRGIKHGQSNYQNEKGKRHD